MRIRMRMRMRMRMRARIPCTLCYFCGFCAPCNWEHARLPLKGLDLTRRQGPLSKRKLLHSCMAYIHCSSRPEREIPLTRSRVNYRALHAPNSCRPSSIRISISSSRPRCLPLSCGACTMDMDAVVGTAEGRTKFVA